MNYYKKIDGLRFVAISMVLIEHFAYFIGSKFSAGYYGVDLFFVISGFLITSILLNSKDPSFVNAYKKFIGRRTLRIFPLYYLTVTILFLAQVEVAQKYIVFLLTYTYNYVEVYYHVPLNALSHFWSLCVEEQFYLFWPFIVLGFRRKPQILFLIIPVLILFSFSQLTFRWIESLNPYNFVNLITRMGSLGLGAFGALLYKTNRVPDNLLRNRWIEYSVYLLLAFLLATSFQIKYLLLGLCSLYLVLKSVHSEFHFKPLNKMLSARLPVYLGSISYGIYVFHLPVAYFVSEYFFDPFWTSINFGDSPIGFIRWHSWAVKLPLYSLITIGLAMLSYRFFERPILSLKDKFFRYQS